MENIEVGEIFTISDENDNYSRRTNMTFVQCLHNRLERDRQRRNKVKAILESGDLKL